jgi:hypothetical protein
MKSVTAAAALGIILGVMGSKARAQAPVIDSLSSNGELISTNLEPDSVAVVEWAPSVDGPWTNTWSGLNAVLVDADGRIRVKVPMFYRVRGVPVGNGPAGMVWIPPGTFTMGSPANEPGGDGTERPQTVVTLTKGFWLGRYEVRQREYVALVGSNPSEDPADLGRPVESVSWNDAVAYCAKLTARERSAGRLPAGHEYRLPTEAQWEYACRAGTTTATAFGNSLSSTQANFDGSYPYSEGAYGPYLGRTTKVGSYSPNAWGLYDMHGNVHDMVFGLVRWVTSRGQYCGSEGPEFGLVPRVSRGRLDRVRASLPVSVPLGGVPVVYALHPRVPRRPSSGSLSHRTFDLSSGRAGRESAAPAFAEAAARRGSEARAWRRGA